jgi:hypothetical protein
MSVSHLLPASRLAGGILEKHDLPMCDLIFLVPSKRMDGLELCDNP